MVSASAAVSSLSTMAINLSHPFSTTVAPINAEATVAPRNAEDNAGDAAASATELSANDPPTATADEDEDDAVCEFSKVAARDDRVNSSALNSPVAMLVSGRSGCSKHRPRLSNNAGVVGQADMSKGEVRGSSREILAEFSVCGRFFGPTNVTRDQMSDAASALVVVGGSELEVLPIAFLKRFNQACAEGL